MGRTRFSSTNIPEYYQTMGKMPTMEQYYKPQQKHFEWKREHYDMIATIYSQTQHQRFTAEIVFWLLQGKVSYEAVLWQVRQHCYVCSTVVWTEEYDNIALYIYNTCNSKHLTTKAIIALMDNSASYQYIRGKVSKVVDKAKKSEWDSYMYAVLSSVYNYTKDSITTALVVPILLGYKVTSDAVLSKLKQK